MNKSYMMSSAQKRIYTLAQIDKSSINYNVPLVIRTKDFFDYKRLQSAFKALCKRHESFRTSFKVEQDKFLQIVHKEVEALIELERSELEDIDKDIEKFIRVFDLSNAPLIRMKLYDYGKDGQALMIDIHHIIFDGFSAQILLRELDLLYKGVELPDIEFQFKDYAAWHNALNFQDEEKYWVEQLKKVTDETAKFFPADNRRPLDYSFAGDAVISMISHNTSEKISEFCKNNNLTESTLFLTILLFIIARYNYTDNAVVGIPAQGRYFEETENIIGMFVNSLFVHLDMSKNNKCIELLKIAQDEIFNSFDHQEYPFEMIAGKINSERDAVSNPVFNTMFSYEVTNSDTINIGDCLCDFYPVTLHISKFDLTLTVKKENNLSYLLHWEYNTDLYREESVNRFSEHFKYILEFVINNPLARVADISCISLEEERYVLNELSPGKNCNVNERSIIQIFEDIVKQYPQNRALIYGETYLTYNEINNSANGLARRLVDSGVKKGQVVGLQTTQTPEMIIGILAILKVGGVYLPIELGTPMERVIHMIQECNVQTILYYNEGNDLKQKDNLNYIEIADCPAEKIFETVNTIKDDLVYI